MNAVLEQTKQIAPHSLEAEEAVIGSVLINPEAFIEVNAFLKAADLFENLPLRYERAWDEIPRRFPQGCQSVALQRMRGVVGEARAARESDGIVLVDQVEVAADAMNLGTRVQYLELRAQKTRVPAIVGVE